MTDPCLLHSRVNAAELNSANAPLALRPDFHCHRTRVDRVTTPRDSLRDLRLDKEICQTQEAVSGGFEAFD